MKAALALLIVGVLLVLAVCAPIAAADDPANNTTAVTEQLSGLAAGCGMVVLLMAVGAVALFLIARHDDSEGRGMK